PFDTARPGVNETPGPGESPLALAVRLAEAKAVDVASANGDAWVLGSPGLAELDGTALGKPGDAERARAQLAAMSGRAVCFHTGVCLARGDGRRLAALDTTTVRFRALSDGEIARYVAAERPLDCAGSFKSEGLGIALFEAIESQDPTALVGLPLIATARLLREAGFPLPCSSGA